ncbi:MAG TPA: hypothetical protein EYP23_03290 [Thermoplasmata archaeon]|nr:hypothetical protein [Thermoplasmata archaeon]
MKSETKRFIETVVIVIILSSSLYVLSYIPVTMGSYTYEVKTFSSYEDFIDFIKTVYKNKDGYYRGGDYTPNVVFIEKSTSNWAAAQTSTEDTFDFSETNVQVEGVDEPDIVKTDGEYIYLVADQIVYIVKAYPWKDASVMSKISINDDISIKAVFINRDKLVVFGSSYRYPTGVSENKCCWWHSVTTTVVNIYDTTDKKSPKLVKNVESDGVYFDARMIGEYVYVITIEYTHNIYRVINGDETINIPEIKVNGVSKKIPVSQIYYVDIPEDDYTFTHMLAVNVNNGNQDVTNIGFLMGIAQTIYVSQHNIYLTSTKYDYLQPVMPNIFVQPRESTVIHRISIKNGDVYYAAQGEVPGRVLNQFSMDEYNGFLRVATTAGSVWGGKSRNNIYILNQELNRVSELEGIAPGERIYSARFMGTKAYLVTFKKVDPFFTIDLSDPYNPKILGELKIPGYSDYLHPYDENHIIGIGKDTVEAIGYQKEMRKPGFAWYQGIKIALFDVTDFEHPRETAKTVIGDRGTDSPVLRDHKALLFDREKDLLVIPVTVYEIDEITKEQYDGYTGNIYGEFTFQGAYVYQVTAENGFEFKGRITHRDENEPSNKYYWYWDCDSTIKRSLYIDNVLYTVSEKMIKMNDLNSLEELNTVELC